MTTGTDRTENASQLAGASDDSSSRREKLSLARQALLERRLKGEVGLTTSPWSAIMRRAETGPQPLSLSQQRLWFIHQLEGASPAYHVTAAVRLEGSLRPAALQAALDTIVQRHEILRTVFVNVKGKPMQVILPEAGFALRSLDPSAESDVAAEVVAAHALNEATAAFSLSAGPLIRGRLLRLGNHEHVLLITMHHIVCDGWSVGILIQEVTQLYAAYEQGQPNPLTELPIQYADYARWQHEWLQGDVQRAQTEYWKRQLQGIPDRLDLPTDYPRPSERSYRGLSIEFALTPELSRQLKALATRHDATLHMVLCTGFALLLWRLTGQDDIVIGTVGANRQRTQIERLIGCFVSTLALRVRLRDDAGHEPALAALLKQVKDTSLTAYANQELPFERVIEALNPPRTLSHSPIFQVLFTLLNLPPSELRVPGLTLTPLPMPERTAQFDLSLVAVEAGEQISGSLNYATDLFTRDTIERWVEHFKTVLKGMVRQADPAIGSLPLLNELERAAVLELAGDAQAAFGTARQIHELFEAQVERSPQAIAVVYDERQLTYAELNRAANRLAHYLCARGTRSGELVALCVERGAAMVTALLAILKADGAYVPVDAGYPIERVEYMLRDAAPKIVITTQRLRHLVASCAANVIAIDADREEIAAQPDVNPTREPPQHGVRQLAYAIYTSGSTGRPKGVMVEHAGVVNVVNFMQQRLQLTAQDRVLAITTLSFDIAALEIYLPLLCGARLVMAGDGAASDAGVLMRLLEERAITTMQATPTTWRLLLSAGWRGKPDLKALCGGEALSCELSDRISSRVAQLWNLYGPTETTIWSCARRITPATQGFRASESIGRPLSGTRIYVLDGCKNLLPRAVAGEIHIGGAGVAHGYVNQPASTAERFIADPFAAEPGARLYSTGDIGRWRADGSLEYLGRNDQQIKLHGFRIEREEIQSVLAKHPRVRQAIVLARNFGTDDQRLVSYVVPRATASDDADAAAQPSFSLFYFGADTYHPQRKYELYLRSARFADEHGFEAIWTPERHFDAVGSLYPNPSILSAALATVTTRVQLRAGSVVVPLHDPIRVAEEWAVVDNLSNGRVGLSLATGWHPRDFVLKPDNFPARRQLVVDAVAALKTLWSGQAIARIDGAGKTVAVSTFPRPTRDELPLWLTSAGNPQTFVEAGRLGVNVLTHLLGQTIEELAGKIALYREALRANGRRPDSGRVTLMVHAFLGTDLEQTLAKTKGPFMSYMRAHLGLLKALAASLDIPTQNISEGDLQTAAAFAFERYARTASLIGTPQSTLRVVGQLQDCGVDEIACLIDWMDCEAALEGLPLLCKLRQLSRAAPPSPRELAGHCRKLLPDYMIPSAFVSVEALPLLPNGKLDCKALPMPDVSAAPLWEYAAPQGEIEESLAEMWKELLQVAHVGRHDSFFDLGGHSLLAMQAISRIQDAFDIQLPVSRLFDAPTLAMLAAFIEEMRSAAPQRADDIAQIISGVESLSEAEAALLLEQVQQGERHATGATF